MKTLLVIGGSGFFGKSILDAYRRRLLDPWDISHLILMARHPDKLLQDVPHLLGEGVELLSADITGVTMLPNADYVIHAAASTDLRDYLLSPAQEKENIYAGTRNFCKLAEEFLKDSKITYVSSGAVYGRQPPDLEKISEDFFYDDIGKMDHGKMAYAIAKRDAENAVRSLAEKSCSVSIARCFAFVGRWLPRNQHFAIGNFIGDVINRKAIAVKASCPVYRSYMYADDLVEWLMRITDTSSCDCQIYNVGSDDAVNLIDLAKVLSYEYNLGLEVPNCSSNTVDRYIPSIIKAQVELGLCLKYNSMEAVLKTINLLEEERL